MLPVVVGRDEGIYVISGASLFAKDDGTPGRIFLNDAYRYDATSGWKVLAGPPVPVLAAAGVPWGPAHILVASGDDGSNFEKSAVLKDDHPGFPDTLWAYHTITDTWVARGTVPAAYVTTQGVLWDGAMVIPGGEDRPGHRSDRVMSGVPERVAKGFSVVDYGTVGVYFACWWGWVFIFHGGKAVQTPFFWADERFPGGRWVSVFWHVAEFDYLRGDSR